RPPRASCSRTLFVSDLARRQPPARAHEVAGVAIRNALQVILVLRLGFPEITDRLDLRDDLARPQTRGVDIRNRVLGDALLFLARVIDGRAIAHANIVPLAI